MPGSGPRARVKDTLLTSFPGDVVKTHISHWLQRRRDDLLTTLI